MSTAEVLGPKGVTAAREHVNHIGKAPIRLASSVHKSNKHWYVFLFVGHLSDWRRRQTLGRSHRGLEQSSDMRLLISNDQ
jgi:hypothetical protein